MSFEDEFPSLKGKGWMRLKVSPPYSDDGEFDWRPDEGRPYRDDEKTEKLTKKYIETPMECLDYIFKDIQENCIDKERLRKILKKIEIPKPDNPYYKGERNIAHEVMYKAFQEVWKELKL